MSISKGPIASSPSPKKGPGRGLSSKNKNVLIVKPISKNKIKKSPMTKRAKTIGKFNKIEISDASSRKNSPHKGGNFHQTMNNPSLNDANSNLYGHEVLDQNLFSEYPQGQVGQPGQEDFNSVYSHADLQYAPNQNLLNASQGAENHKLLMSFDHYSASMNQTPSGKMPPKYIKKPSDEGYLSKSTNKQINRSGASRGGDVVTVICPTS
jgi:hypothetical protein